MPRYHRKLNSFTGKLIGDWTGVEHFFNDLGIEVKKKTLQAQWEIAKKLKKIVVGHLLAQDLNWPPLSPKTIANKKDNKGLILISTETYLDNIKVWRTSDKVFVGVKKGITYKGRGKAVSLERVAMWQEYGTSKSPARPLWGPSINEIGNKAGIKNFVVDAIFRRLKWLARGKPITITKSQVRNLVK